MATLILLLSLLTYFIHSFVTLFVYLKLTDRNNEDAWIGHGVTSEILKFNGFWKLYMYIGFCRF